MQHLWNKLDEVLPTLNRQEQGVIIEEMRGRALATADFHVLLVLSASIAFFGLSQNSSAVVIGAMLIAPMMNPMMALGFGLVTGSANLFWRAASSTVTGVAVAVGTSALLAFLTPSNEPTAEILARTRPDLLDLLVALTSGAAGAYAVCRKEVAASLPGVAIAVALVPPLCVIGYGLGAGRINLAGGATILFATNLASIVLSGIAVFWLLGFRPSGERRAAFFHRNLRWAVFGVLALALPLGYATYLQIREANRQAAIERVLTRDLDPAILELEDISTHASDDRYVVGFTAYVYADTAGKGGANIDAIHRQLEEAVGEPVTLRARVIASELGVVAPEARHAARSKARR